MTDEPTYPATPEPHHPYAPPQSAQAVAPEVRSSGMGIASFVIGLFAALATLAVFAYAGYVETTTPGGMDESSPVAMLVGLGIFACAGLLILGLLLGVAALFQANRSRMFAVLGLLINGLVLGGAVTLVLIGLSMPA